MARRTEPKPEVGTPPPIPPGPWPEPPKERRPRLGWAALALVLVAALGTGGWLVFEQKAPHHQPTPERSAPSAAGTATLPVPVPATTYEAFAALTNDQQQAVMQQVMTTYDATVGLAVRNLDASLLPRVASGDQLAALQSAVSTEIQKRQPVADSATTTIRAIVMSPQPYSFVSIDVSATETSQYLDPTTLQPVGAPSVKDVRSSFSVVIEGGVWKVSEHIGEAS